jgi:hypothetical protein
LSWLTTSRNTLVASSGTVSTLQSNATPQYALWNSDVTPYLRIGEHAGGPIHHHRRYHRCHAGRIPADHHAGMTRPCPLGQGIRFLWCATTHIRTAENMSSNHLHVSSHVLRIPKP